MKKFFTILACCFFWSAVQAQQNNVNIFSEVGGPFFLFVNGVQMNQEPQANIKVLGLTGDSYQLRMVFKDNSVPALKQNIWFHDRNTDDTYIIKHNRKGKMVVRPFGQDPLGQGPAGGFILNYNNGNPSLPQASQPLVANPEPQPSQPVYTEPQNPAAYMHVETHIEEHPQQVHRPGSVRIEMEMGPNGAEIRVEDGQGGRVQTGTHINPNNPTSVQMHIETSGGWYDEQGVWHEEAYTGDFDNGWYDEQGFWHQGSYQGNLEGGWYDDNGFWHQGAPQDNWEQPQPAQTQPQEGLCAFTMTSDDAADLITHIKKESFESNMLSVAKQAIEQTCMSVSQIAKVMRCFTHESSKLDFATFAYKYCADPHNYYKLNSEFTHSSSKAALSEAIKQ